MKSYGGAWAAAVPFGKGGQACPLSLCKRALHCRATILLGAVHGKHLAGLTVGPTVGTRLAVALCPVPPMCREVTLAPSKRGKVKKF